MSIIREVDLLWLGADGNPVEDGGSTPTPEWTITRNGVDITSQVGQPTFDSNSNYWNTSMCMISGDNIAFFEELKGTANQQEISWHATDESGEMGEVSYVATRSL